MKFLGKPFSDGVLMTPGVLYRNAAVDTWKVGAIHTLCRHADGYWGFLAPMKNPASAFVTNRGWRYMYMCTCPKNKRKSTAELRAVLNLMRAAGEDVASKVEIPK